MLFASEYLVTPPVGRTPTDPAKHRGLSVLPVRQYAPRKTPAMLEAMTYDGFCPRHW
jgi:hypothetical protein